MAAPKTPSVDDAKLRCSWPKTELARSYHDDEWGTPLHDERRLFEMIVLDGAQAGLSWEIILSKRENYREAFHQFDVERVARYTARDERRLLENPGIVRNRLKIASAVHNAKAFIALAESEGTFDRFLWAHVEFQPIQNAWTESKQIPVTSPLSDRLSKSLKQHGFKFVGSTICYAMMQACGMVNDHLAHCFRHAELGGSPPRKPKKKRPA